MDKLKKILSFLYNNDINYEIKFKQGLQDDIFVDLQIQTTITEKLILKRLIDFGFICDGNYGLVYYALKNESTKQEGD